VWIAETGGPEFVLGSEGPVTAGVEPERPRPLADDGVLQTLAGDAQGRTGSVSREGGLGRGRGSGSHSYGREWAP